MPSPSLSRRAAMRGSSVLIGGSALIALVFIGAFLVLWRISEDRVDSAFAAEAEKVRSGFDLALDGMFSQMQALATIVAGTPAVQEIFAQASQAVADEGGGPGGTRAAVLRSILMESVEPQWRHMQQRFGARQLHFHLPDGDQSVSFLRVHAPDKFGDRLDDLRHIIADVHRDGLPRTGFELGRIYSGLRGVVPVTATADGRARRLGVLEAGTSFDVQLDVLDRQFGGGIAVLLRRDLVADAMWDEFLTRSGMPHGEACGCYVEAASRGDVMGWLQDGLIQPLNGGDVEYYRLMRDGRTFNLIRFPLRDYLGMVDPDRQPVGSVAVWIDHSDIIANETGILMVQGGLVLGGYGLTQGLFLWGWAFGRRRRAAERTLEAERALFAGGPVAVFVWRMEPGWPIEYVSQNVAALTGHTAADLIAGTRRFETLVHPDDRARVAAEIATFQAAGRTSWEQSYRLVRADGTAVWVYDFTMVEPGQAGAPSRVRGYLVDQTEQHALQSEVARARQSLDFVLSAAPAVTYSLPLGASDGEQEDVYISPGVTAILGYPVAEVLADAADWWLGAVHPDDRPAVEAGMDPATWPRGRIERVYRMRHRNGGWRWIEDRCRFLTDATSGSGRLIGSLVDVSGRVELQQRLDKIAANLPGVIYQVQQHPDGRISMPYASAGLHDIYGVAPATVVDDATPALACIHPDDLPAVRAAIAESARTLTPWEHRHCVRHPRKGDIWVAGHAMPERLSDGSVLWHGYVGDITQAKRDEQALLHSQERFELALFGADLGVWDWHLPTGRVSFNDRWASMLGYELGEIEPDVASWQKLVHPDDWPLVIARLEPHLRGETPHYECEHRVRHKDGRWLWILDRGKVLERDAAGEPVRAVGTHLDITERRAAENALRESERRFHQLAESVDIVFWIRTTDHMLYVNPVYERVWGRPVTELYANANTFLDSVHPDDWPRVLAAVQREVGEGHHFNEEYRILRPDGEVRWIHAVSHPVLNGADGVVRSAGTATDVTDARQAQRDLARSNAELEQFAYVASHDLRQPLRMVNSYLALIQRALGDTLDGEVAEFMGYALDGAQRMDRLIVDLLEYSRIGRADHPPVPVALDDIVAQARHNLTVAIAESGATISVAEDLPVVPGHPSELMRLFQNLIGNAIKYGRADAPPRITIDWRPEDPFGGVVTVADNGPGIDPKDHERIFGVFQRLVPRGQVEGTGIGLAVCRKIAEHHGGRIWVESAPGQETGQETGQKGATFCVRLPQVIDPVRNTTPEPVDNTS